MKVLTLTFLVFSNVLVTSFVIGAVGGETESSQTESCASRQDSVKTVESKCTDGKNAEQRNSLLELDHPKVNEPKSKSPSYNIPSIFKKNKRGSCKGKSNLNSSFSLANMDIETMKNLLSDFVQKFKDAPDSAPVRLDGVIEALALLVEHSPKASADKEDVENIQKNMDSIENESK